MAYEISLLEYPQGLCVSFKGLVTGSMIAEAVREAAAYVKGDGMRTPLQVLWDTRSVRSLVVSPVEMPEIDGAMHELHTRAGRSALLYEQGAFDLHLFVRLISARAPQGSPQRRLFTVYEAAIAWLKEG